jgi:hypothetical protein
MSPKILLQIHFVFCSTCHNVGGFFLCLNICYLLSTTWSHSCIFSVASLLLDVSTLGVCLLGHLERLFSGHLLFLPARWCGALALLWLVAAVPRLWCILPGSLRQRLRSRAPTPAFDMNPFLRPYHCIAVYISGVAALETRRAQVAGTESHFQLSGFSPCSQRTTLHSRALKKRRKGTTSIYQYSVCSERLQGCGAIYYHIEFCSYHLPCMVLHKCPLRAQTKPP